jgi:hypothetical protein
MATLIESFGLCSSINQVQILLYQIQKVKKESSVEFFVLVSEIKKILSQATDKLRIIENRYANLPVTLIILIAGWTFSKETQRLAYINRHWYSCSQKVTFQKILNVYPNGLVYHDSKSFDLPNCDQVLDIREDLVTVRKGNTIWMEKRPINKYLSAIKAKFVIPDNLIHCPYYLRNDKVVFYNGTDVNVFTLKANSQEKITWSCNRDIFAGFYFDVSDNFIYIWQDGSVMIYSLKGDLLKQVILKTWTQEDVLSSMKMYKNKIFVFIQGKQALKCKIFSADDGEYYREFNIERFNHFFVPNSSFRFPPNCFYVTRDWHVCCYSLCGTLLFTFRTSFRSIIMFNDANYIYLTSEFSAWTHSLY